MLCYSVRSATTGSFFAAIFAGTNPAISVSTILIITRITAPATGSFATPAIVVTFSIIRFAGMHKISVITIPSAPDTKPSISVSALNTRETSFFDAPILLKIPIYFVLSSTEIYVIIPIIIEETTSEIATNAISTAEIAVIIVLTDDIIMPT